MTDLELMLSLLNKSKDFKEHFTCRDAELYIDENGRINGTIISLTDYADQIDIYFNNKGEIL
jgi:hypothetical protein